MGAVLDRHIRRLTPEAYDCPILILFRHARTSNNAEARLQGKLDSPLDGVGHEQAKLAGEAIHDRWDVDRIVTTSLRRTRETAELAGLSHLPTAVDDRWQEIDFGEFDDRRIAEVIEELGTAWTENVDFVPPNGESMAAMHGRVGEALADLVDAAERETIVVVTHASPIKSAVTWLLKGDVATILRLRVSPASITAFTPAPNGLLLTDYNWCPARGVSGTSPRQIATLDQPNQP